MNFETAIPTFNLLSIGQRGVGKTVFLAGSYAEFHAERQSKFWRKLWFDCQDHQAQENIGSILSYIIHSGKYPPPTMKITNFGFSLKRRRLWGAQTLSHFRWSDIPGEICTINNRDFRAMVSNSHGCCVFIDAYALVHEHRYLQALEEIVKQVMAIASLAHLHDFSYPFVVILTKCDRLNPTCLHQQLEPVLQPLTTRLDAVKANYQTFYSLIPITCTSGAASLRPTGAAAPLLWLVWELSQPYHPSWLHNLHDFIIRVRTTDQAVKVKQKLDLPLLPAAHSQRWILALAFLALVGFSGLAYLQWHKSNSANENPQILHPEN